MDRLREMEVLVAVADAGSFARAGQRLHMSPPAVTRAISALESRLGTRVFNRTTRQHAITEAGQRFLDNARRILAEVEAAERDAAGEMATPRGHLTITAPATFGRLALTPVVCAFLNKYPGVTASVLLLDRVTNLIEEGIDAAVRIGVLPDSGMVARNIGSVRRVLVASPAYLERRGTPKEPADLKRHSMISFSGLMPGREWRFHGQAGGKSVSLQARLEINDAIAAMAAAEAGDGIAVAFSYMASEKVRQGALVPVLDAFAPPPVPVSLIHPESRLVLPRVRAFMDLAAPQLRKTLQRLAMAPAR
ncbi:MAG TPA: LysR family transcriptional regulator [Hyphomonas sp.]|nr:LysR family transcriptional regulator [Hyphomonas sp.]